MAATTDVDAIVRQLHVWLEADLSHYRVDRLGQALAALAPEESEFILSWIKRMATVHLELGWQFGRRAPRLLTSMGQRQMSAWAVLACDTYDRQGLRAALQTLEKVEDFASKQLEMTAGVLFADMAGILGNFVRGLSGRKLALEQGEVIHTDSERIFLPAVIAALPDSRDNFQIAKAAVALQWAQIRFGSCRLDWRGLCQAYPDPQRALRQLHGLESVRLFARLAQELPGLHREMTRLQHVLGESLAHGWHEFLPTLQAPGADIAVSAACLPRAYALPDFHPWRFQGEVRPEAVAAAFAARQEREKARLRVKLKALQEEQAESAQTTSAGKAARPSGFSAQPRDAEGRLEIALSLDGIPLAPPEGVRQLMLSVYLDFGEIPPEYLVPAGEGEYAPEQLGEAVHDPDAVWKGTYHEEGAQLYPEWDAGRQHYRKNWAVMRERDVEPVFDDFPRATLEKHAGLIKRLRRGFEAMRDENRTERRQAQGDEIDIDALVEALADARDGREMSDRLFLRQHRSERNIAVAIMVDMSGSTRGWINEAEREAVLLLCEVLTLLGDRYAIYGFSGVTRKRCELYRIKRFEEPYSAEVRARIAGIRAQEYTRMGFAVRHLTALLKRVEARTRVLVTLSDGRPDDYFDGYRGPYGIEDTRMALLEAKRSGVHPFCITIDREARDYLPHMYGAASYVILDDVEQLPVKVADIYRRITTRS